MTRFVVLLTLLPILIILVHLRGFDPALFLTPEFMAALRFSLLQALLSGVFCVGLACLLVPPYAQGFERFKKIKSVVRAFLLFPQVVSPVFVVLGILLTFPHFPFGLTGVVLGNVFVNGGLCLLVLGEKAGLIESQWWGLSRFLGASRFFYYRRILFPLLWPSVLSVFSLVFVFCLSSLVIPLSLGGGPQSSTLEVLIYEKIKASGDVVGAVEVAIAQALIQFLIYFLVFRNIFQPKLERSRASGFNPALMVGSKNAIRFGDIFSVISFTGLLVWPYAQVIKVAVANWSSINELFENGLSVALFMSFVVAISVGFLVTLFVVIWNVKGSRSTVLRVPHWSALLLGLSGFLVFSTRTYDSHFILYFALVCFEVLGLSLITVRVVAPPLIQSYQKYFPIIRVWGGSPWFLIKKIFYPLNSKVYWLAALLAFCWSIGEFSTAALIAPSGATLPLYIESLLSQYRLEGAAVAAVFLFVFGFIGSIAGEVLYYGQN